MVQNRCEHKRERTGLTYKLVSPREPYPYIGHTTRRKTREQEHRRRPTKASACVTRYKDFQFVVTQVLRETMTKNEFRALLETAEQKAIDACNGQAYNLRRANWRHPWSTGQSAVSQETNNEQERKFWHSEEAKAKKAMNCVYAARYRAKNVKKVKQSRAKWEQSEAGRQNYAARQDRYWTKYWRDRGREHYGKYAGCDKAQKNRRATASAKQ